MAGLSNTGIKGFIASAKLTGEKIIKKGQQIPEMVEHFLSGFTGHGWKIWEWVRGRYMLEIDDIRVRGTLTAYELLVQKIRAIVGALAITQANGKIKSVTLTDDGSFYLIELEEEISFMSDDFILHQTFTGKDVKKYHVLVDGIENNKIKVSIEEFDWEYDSDGIIVVNNPPKAGDEIVQFGNRTNKDRQSAIYIHTDETRQPVIDVMFGVNSKDWSNNVKIRLGGDIPDSEGLKGFYVENGMIKGTDENGSTIYCIYPNGKVELGAGSAEFNPDKSGHLAGEAIKWYWNEDLQKFRAETRGVFRGAFSYVDASNPPAMDFTQNMVIYYSVPEGDLASLTLPGGDAVYEGTCLNIILPSYTNDMNFEIRDGIYVDGTDIFFKCQIKTTDKFVCVQVICYKDSSNRYVWEVLNAYSKVRGTITSI